MTANSLPSIGMVHYSAPPVVGGVEAVMQAHAAVMVQAGYPVTIVAGEGDGEALPEGTEFIRVPEMHSLHDEVKRIGDALVQGDVPEAFEGFSDELVEKLSPILREFDNVIVHNVFTKHFNLPLTAALFRLLDDGAIRKCIAWCHDLTWTSPSSRSEVQPGYPWDLLRTYRDDVVYVTVSEQRQKALADLLGCSQEQVHVVYNGVNAQELLGLSEDTLALANRLHMLSSDLILFMPVRVTRAKNIEYAIGTVARLKALGCGVKLVLTGPPDPHKEESMDYFRSLLDLRSQLNVDEEMRFVFTSGPDPDEPFYIDMKTVSELYRMSDLMFMPSHREGFGMPVLEAGLVGIPVVCTDVPAAEEIGGDDVIQFDGDEDPERVAWRILRWAERSRVHRLRKRVRQRYTWRAILEQDIEPLLRRPTGESAAEEGTPQ